MCLNFLIYKKYTDYGKKLFNLIQSLNYAQLVIHITCCEKQHFNGCNKVASYLDHSQILVCSHGDS